MDLSFESNRIIWQMQKVTVDLLNKDTFVFTSNPMPSSRGRLLSMT